MLNQRWLPVLALSSALAGCSADNLYIGHKTNLGLNVSYNQTKPSGRFIFGYKEQFITVIPKTAPLAPETARELNGAETDSRDAMAVLACSDVKVGTIELKEYSEYLATGAAARRHARALVAGEAAPLDEGAAKVFAFEMRNSLNTATTAIDKAITAAADATTLTAMKEKVGKLVTSLSALIDGPANKLATGIDDLAKGDLKTTIGELAAAEDAEVKATGINAQNLLLKRATARAEARLAGALDDGIFSCFKNPSGN